MVAMKKKILTISMALTIASLSVPSQLLADRDTMFRKGLGIAGVCIAVSGLWNVVKLRPGRGLARIVTGAVIAIGAMCSDIIFARFASIVSKEASQRRQPREGFLGGILDAGEDTFAGIRHKAHDAYHGLAEPVGNAMSSDIQIENGKQSLRNGQILTGLDQITDGLYYNIRKHCSLALYPEFWGRN